MAKNLRAKMPEGDRLVICDRNEKATSRFVQEASGPSSNNGAPRTAINIEVADTPRDVVEKSVSPAFTYFAYTLCSM
jgi:hypothetical protein